jgi:hypothetical protein
VLTERIAPGVAAIVDGFRVLLARLASQIAESLGQGTGRDEARCIRQRA